MLFFFESQPHAESPNSLFSKTKPFGNMGKRKLKTTEKQIAANQANAQNSTGPITPAGKARASRNALTHGLLAKEIVIDDGEGAESREEFDSVLLDLTGQFDPQSPLEEILVEKIAVAYWRSRRAHRYEVGLIRWNLDNATDKYYHGGRLPSDKRKRDDEIDTEISEAQELRRAWERDRARFTKMRRDGKNLQEIYDWQDNWDLVFAKAPEIMDEPPDYTPEALHTALQEAGWTDERIWQCHIEVCAEQMEFQARKIQDLEKEKQRNRLAVQVQKKLGAVPDARDLDRLLKYEGSIDRQFYKAIDQLERLQRLRAGDNVPAPVNIDLAVDTKDTA
jgi:hypothetical protein